MLGGRPLFLFSGNDRSLEGRLEFELFETRLDIYLCLVPFAITNRCGTCITTGGQMDAGRPMRTVEVKDAVVRGRIKIVLCVIG